MTTQESCKKWVEAALECARRWKSPETGFLHFSSQEPENSASQKIPVVENFIYILALLKARRVETIQEAQLLLQRLLCYQTTDPAQGLGNFPLYLHEFPFCYSRRQPVALLAPLYWIAKNIHPSMGEGLKNAFAGALGKCLDCSVDLLQYGPVDYLTHLRIACAAVSIGELLKQSNRIESGNRMLDDLFHLGEQPIWHSREGIADVLQSLQMVYPKISESPWSHFWSHVSRTWHPQLKVYCGPCFEEWQRGSAAERHLYDFYMAAYTGDIPPHGENARICHLYAALLLPTEDVLSAEAAQEVEGLGWRIKKGPCYAISTVDRTEELDPVLRKGFRCMHFQWAAGGVLYSFSCEGNGWQATRAQFYPSELELVFRLPVLSDEDKSYEKGSIAFYCSPRDKIHFLVHGSRATTFRLGEPVEAAMLEGPRLLVELIEGQGDFLGHLMPGNRPSQRLVSKREVQEAYDWKILVRMIRQSTPCLLRLRIGFDG